METNKTPTKWLTRKTVVMAGLYKTKEVTEHYTADGEFSILPAGRMYNGPCSGTRGPMKLRWSWQGYSLRDNRKVEPWASLSGHCTTVKDAKAKANRAK